MSGYVYYLLQGSYVLLVGLFVCQKDYAKTTSQIFMKIGGRMEHGPEQNPLHFGADQDKGVDPGFFIFFLSLSF